MNVGSFISIHKCEYIYIYILMNSDTRKHKILLVIFFKLSVSVHEKL